MSIERIEGKDPVPTNTRTPDDLRQSVHHFVSILAIETLIKNKVIDGNEFLAMLDQRADAMTDEDAPGYALNAAQKDAVKSEFGNIRQIIATAANS